MIKMKYVKQMGEILNFISYKISLIAIIATILACVDIDNEVDTNQQLDEGQQWTEGAQVGWSRGVPVGD